MSVWGQITWDVARSGGFVAYGLLTLSVALGLALSMRWQAPWWPRLINSELHNFVTLLSLVFTIIHVLAVWLDPFTAFGWTEIFIPFVSHYRPIWMAFGVVGLYLGLALAASVWLRPYLGYEWWRRLHVLTLAVFALVTVHGLTTGSDSQTPWAIMVYFASGLMVAALLWVRLLAPASPQQRRHPLWVALSSVGLFVGVALAVIGPMRPGWNAFANSGNGSGQRVALASAGQSGATSSPTPTMPPAPPASALAPPFQAQASGSLREQGPDARGRTTVTVTATLQGGGRGVMEIQLIGTREPDGTLLVSRTQTLVGQDWNTPTYQGQLSDLSSSGNTWRLEGVLSPVNGAGSAMDLRISLIINSDDTVSGTVQASVYSGPPPGSSGGGDDDG
ncbi:MAG TPA: ferric reductase-like transmembrane domain-containing protein [Ktedonobacterales bacterium]|nr:ferric reductase-like transmembrane domain-containing protein [Ktedonobacterales bacterium]